MKKKFAITLLVLFAIACAGPKYFTAPDFMQKTTNHKLIAVLPFQMVMTGKKPEKLTDEDIAKVEEGIHDADNGRVFSTKEARKKLKKWLK